MFGYVKPFVPELKVRQHELYKAIYCSICRESKKKIGLFPTFFLSYDLVFLAAMRMAVSKECPGAKAGRCSYNPLKKCTFISDSEEIAYSSGCAALLIYYKLKDDVSDSSGIGKLLKSLLLPFAKHSAKKAKKRLCLPSEEISLYYSEFSSLEKKENVTPGELADAFGNMLSSVASFGKSDLESFALSKIFYSLGKWIYLIDALDDLDKDRRKGNFNPFLVHPEYTGYLSDSLISILCEADGIILSLDYANSDLKDIIINIYRHGTEKVQKDILEKKGKKSDERSLQDS